MAHTSVESPGLKFATDTRARLPNPALAGLRFLLRDNLT